MVPALGAAIRPGEAVPDNGTLVDLPGRAERLHLCVEDQQVRARFVDAEGLLIEPPAESIVLEVNQPGHRHHRWRAFLQPGPDHTLTTALRLPAPYQFRARLIIRFGPDEIVTLPNVPLNLDRNLP